MQSCSPNSHFLGVQGKINKIIDLDWNGPKHRSFTEADKQILSGGTYHLDTKPQSTLTIPQVKWETQKEKKKVEKEIPNCRKITAKISDIGIIRFDLIWF